MTNNDILRRLRYAFDLNDSKVIALFALANLNVTRAEMSDWLKKEDDPAYQSCSDQQLATFLNGFINDKRGKREGEQPVAEKTLTNNLVFRKLRIALNFKDSDILETLALVGYRLSKPELSAFFRKADHRQYRQCKDQILRNFLHGLQIKYRPDNTSKNTDKVTGAATLSTPKDDPIKQRKPVAKPTFQWQEK